MKVPSIEILKGERSRFLLRDERGFLGLGGILTALVIVAIFGMVLGMLGVFEWLIKEIGAQVGIGKLLIHVPQLTMSGEGPGGFLQAGTVAGNLYGTFRLVAFAVITVGFVVIGLSYALEQFNVMRPGTAESLLSESVLIIILIFIFPWFYNAGAVALNGLNEGVVMHADHPIREEAGPETGYEEMAVDVVEQAGDVPALLGEVETGLPIIGSISDPSKAITVLVCGTVSFMALFIAIATGVFRLLATAALAAAFPLILALRLLPPIRDVSRRLTSGLIGVMLSTVVIAIFFRVAWGILATLSPGSFANWVFGAASLLVAAGAFTITAPTLSGMAGSISGTIGRGTAGSVAGMTAALGTGSLGMMAGAGRGIAGVAGAGGMSLWGRGGAKAVGSSALRGLAAGAPSKGVMGSVGAGAAAGRTGALRGIAGARPEMGQVDQTVREYTEHANARADDIKENYDPATVGNLAEKGRRLATGIDEASDEELFRSRAEVTKGIHDVGYTDRDIEAMMEEGEIQPREIRRGQKEALAELKDRSDLSEEEQYAAFYEAVGGKRETATGD